MKTGIATVICLLMVESSVGSEPSGRSGRTSWARVGMGASTEFGVLGRRDGRTGERFRRWRSSGFLQTVALVHATQQKSARETLRAKLRPQAMPMVSSVPEVPAHEEPGRRRGTALTAPAVTQAPPPALPEGGRAEGAFGENGITVWTLDGTAGALVDMELRSDSVGGRVAFAVLGR